MKSSEPFLLEFFKSHGFSAEKIEESSEKSPDFLLFDGNLKFLIELKQKTDSDSTIEKRESAYKSEALYESLSVIERTNRNSNIIKSASKQLAAQKESYGADCCLVVFEAVGFNSNAKRDQFEASLYGSVEVMNIGENYCPPKPCYFFDNSDFFNQRMVLDGAFIIGERTGKLCLNPLSPNYDVLKQSHLVSVFSQGVLDPIELEEQGRAYIVDAPINRRDKEAVVRYLASKYELDRVVPFNWPHYNYSASVKVEK
ncbi:hypothetical protein MT303_004832 [Vibrio parahaemolyticus]|nr:hypothetical protein [Vibrio parahaemolyticus]EIV8636987.1 hypothetical protein [Vibrio parahaemolyticus]EIZ1450791.1 hypothetical protein [Vibrio parahaemolyticus]EJF4460643.1 hypothetical protein [Vibrio parahaemolyticus]EKL0056939.1 hypothetical protein [Vibrio parahaemolyticus]